MGSLAMGGKGSKYKNLSKADLAWLTAHTRYSEETILEWFKGFKQDCPDGRLTAESFMKIYSKCFPAGNVSEFCEHVFRTFDTDKNGFIDFKEFLLAIDVTSSGCPEEKLNWAFSMYDVDGNGWIDLVEMTRIVKSIYNMMGPNQVAMDKYESPEARAEGIFKRMDVNKDGKVTRQEFVRCCLEDQKLIELLTPNVS